ncbi:MAG: HAD family hydrolase [Thermoplasmatota archaeon]
MSEDDIVKNEDTLLIFDLDGTLFKTRSTVIPAVKGTLRELGIREVTDEKIISLLGETTQDFCEGILEGEEEKIDQFIECFWRYEKKYIEERGELYKGIKEMLDKLSFEGFKMAICSNGSEDYIHHVLKKTSIADHFDIILSSSKYKNKTIAIEKIIETVNIESLAIMIGDKKHDFDAALEIGILSIGVGYGYGTPHELTKADYLVETPSEIPRLISKIVKTWNRGTY